MFTRRNKKPKKKKAAPKKKMGRKSKFTDERKNIICQLLSEGMTKKGASRIAGIAQSTFYAWVSDMPEFSEEVKRAEAEAEKRWIKWAEDKKDYRFLLPKRFRDDWGDKQEVELTGDHIEFVLKWPEEND